ncbi:3-methyl-2-oxobutanoate dehydrogenase subunit VorB [Myxococcota bacterium]|nr:3-methyl-2-oxobutanoate dehydrogenase subunit VorB [Myxococcota bacterium]MBU1896952.1 3-methyl-2-oxobutanoate dehydrogenase subunit VorB [Myxococcota bacterium]
MATQLMKGNDAIIIGALAAGCRAYFGYPITPASEIAHAAAIHFPALGGTFIQAESEVSAVNMLYGTAGMGIRSMTATASPGFSLKQEGLSYCAGAEVPAVVVDVQRGGPGLGNIAPEQSDYFQATKGGGHGNYRLIVLAPNSAQEMCDLTGLAFELAEKYRNPACILTDGFVGQMMESVDIPEPKALTTDHRSWAVDGTPATRGNLINSIYLDPYELEAHNLKLQAKYERCEVEDVRFEESDIEDADLIVVAYGIVSRVALSTIALARAKGQKVGIFRPITLYPFPTKRLAQLAEKTKKFLVSELSTGQMVEDVKLAVGHTAQVRFFGRCGGVVPTGNELLDQYDAILGEEG